MPPFRKSRAAGRNINRPEARGQSKGRCLQKSPCAKAMNRLTPERLLMAADWQNRRAFSANSKARSRDARSAEDYRIQANQPRRAKPRLQPDRILSFHPETESPLR